MTDFLFDVPWWVPVVLAAAGIVAFFLLGRDKRAVAAGGGLIALAIVVTAVSVLIDTPTEQAIARTRGVVEAVDARDWDRLGALLDEPTRLPGFYANRREFLAGAEATIGAVDLTSAAASKLEVKETAGIIDVFVTVWSTQAATLDRPYKSLWRFEYVPTGDGLVLGQIEPRELGGRDVSEINSRLVRAR